MQIIHNYMTIGEGLFILKETHRSVARKERMLTNKQRFGVFRSISTEKHEMERLPSMECDFGLQIPNHLYAFKSRVFAFNVVLSGLGVELN